MKRQAGERLFVREASFVETLASLMTNNPDFLEISLEPRVENPRTGKVERPDLLAIQISKGKRRKLIVECKNRPIFKKDLDLIVEQLRRYQMLVDISEVVLAIPSRMNRSDRERLEAEHVEVWDSDDIGRIFKDQIAILPSDLQLAFRAAESSGEQSLIEELRACKPGRAEWSVYQKLVGRVIERCFCPPLNSPLSELPDQSGANRRDFILENFAEGGFWSHMKSRHLADYIVVDAKNYAGKIKKRDILQIANYLKAHGAGLFGIIFSRHGADISAHVTVREQWVYYNKMVVILDDQRCEVMINSASSGQSELVLAKAIQDFRLGI